MEFEEASGDRLDSSGYTNTLTPTGTPGNRTGKIGNAYTNAWLGGTYLSRANNYFLQANDRPVTFTGWIAAPTWTNNVVFFSKWGASTEYLLWYNGTKLAFSATKATGGNVTLTADALGTPSANTWYFVAVWYDYGAGTLNIQVDNGTINSTALAGGIVANTQPFVVGAYGDFSAKSCMAIDELGLWNRVLSASERTTLFGLTRPVP